PHSADVTSAAIFSRRSSMLLVLVLGRPRVGGRRRGRDTRAPRAVHAGLNSARTRDDTVVLGEHLVARAGPPLCAPGRNPLRAVARPTVTGCDAITIVGRGRRACVRLEPLPAAAEHRRSHRERQRKERAWNRALHKSHGVPRSGGTHSLAAAPS